MDSPFMTTKDAAEYLRRPQETLRQWRHRGYGPKSFRLGGRIVYRRDVVEAWIAAQEQATCVGDTA